MQSISERINVGFLGFRGALRIDSVMPLTSFEVSIMNEALERWDPTKGSSR
jgi:hypothetical protein